MVQVTVEVKIKVSISPVNSWLSLCKKHFPAHLRLLAALPEALAHATPTQARRVRAYYIAGISQPEISRREGVDRSKVSVAIRRGLRNMRRCYDCLFPAE